VCDLDLASGADRGESLIVFLKPAVLPPPSFLKARRG
jgi:hypothetical protein